jgi:hypothetical protein
MRSRHLQSYGVLRAAMSECAGKTDFVLFGIQRMSTTWRFSLLKSHPKIVCHGEVFQNDGCLD